MVDYILFLINIYINMITNYTTYINEAFYENERINLYLCFNVGNLYIRPSKTFLKKEEKYIYTLFFKRLKTFFKKLGIILRKTGGEYSFNINNDDLDINVKNFMIFYYYKILGTNRYIPLINKNFDEICEYFKKIFEFKIDDDMINIIDNYILKTSNFDNSLIPYLTDIQIEKYKHFIDAKNFDLI